MGDKKGKALAMDIMDDLLGENPKASLVDHDDTSLLPEANEDHPANEFNLNADEAPPEGATDIHATEISHGTEVSSQQLGRPSESEDPNDDRTVRIGATSVQRALPKPAPAKRPPQPKSNGGNRVRASVGRFGAFRGGGTPSSATEAALAQSENLRVAQNRLLELEQELERLRLQNEELAAAAETLRRRTDELTSVNQRRENDFQNAVQTFRQERDLLASSKDSIQRDYEVLQQKNEELELRLSTNIQKIRVRERELENRLELVRLESAAVVRNKDEMILDLKRQIDQLNMELNNYRGKNQELNRQTNEKQEMLRRTVKALRLALSMLEGDEESAQKPGAAAPLKKVK